MKFTPTPLDGLILIEPKVFGDTRGFFLETWNRERYREAGFPDVEFVQDNHSRSAKGVLRGLHYQRQHPQGKLVQVTTGAVFDVAVDIRPESKTFGQWYGCVLSEENHRQLWVPAGFAHGFCVLSEVADFCYKCTDYYHPEDEGGIRWNDPAIGIDWKLAAAGIKDLKLSDKDKANPLLADVPVENLPRIDR